MRAEQAAQVLAKAVLRAADALGLNHRVLSSVLGLSEASISRLRAKKTALPPATPAGERALVFLRVYRSLDTLVGGSSAAAQAWLNAENTHLSGVPLERIQHLEGLVHVADYLDAMRGKL